MIVAQDTASIAKMLGIVYDTLPEHYLTVLDLSRVGLSRHILDRLTSEGHLEYIDYSASPFAIAFWQVARASARFFLDVEPPIHYGDFIKARGTGALGIVINTGEIQRGKATISGYWIETANGEDDFIPAGDAILIA